MTGIHRIAVASLLLIAAAAPVAWSDDGDKPAKAKGPVKVYILAGQSNMDGLARINTVDFLGEDEDPARAALLQKFKPDGENWMTRSDVWVANGAVNGDLRPGYGGRRDYSKLGNNIGPEYAFGYFMGEHHDEQVLLIKYGPGGQSLHLHFRPPSAEPIDNDDIDGQGGPQYRTLVGLTHDALDNLKERFPSYDEEAGYEIVGLVWFQGFNDMFNERGRAEYGSNLVHFIKDIREEFNAPNMKVVVGVMGVNGVSNEVGKQKQVRDGQRHVNTVPEFAGNVKAIETAPLLHPDIVAIKTAGWLNTERNLETDPVTEEEKAMLHRATSDKGFHYYGEGRFFILAGQAFAQTMIELQAGELPPAER